MHPAIVTDSAFSTFPATGAPARETAGRGGATTRRGPRSAGSAVTRGLALFLGGFSLINLVGGVVVHGFDVNIWWIDLRPLPHPLGGLTLAAIAAALLGYGARPAMGMLRRAATAGTLGIALIASLWNCGVFFILLTEGSLPSAFPVPFSLLVALSLGAILWSVLLRAGEAPPRRPLLAATVAGSLVLFPLMQMFCFGRTDYRRPADAVVVLGAKAYADGTPSVPLGDRVRTACQLYHAGLAPRLIFSGGPGDGAISEPESMRMMAIGLGVPDSAIILDEMGLNTQATIDNTIPIFRRIGARRVMAVSNFYHLPRIKMTYQRDGWDVYTVPAVESYTLRALPLYVMREVAGLWAYYAVAVWR